VGNWLGSFRAASSPWFPQEGQPASASLSAHASIQALDCPCLCPIRIPEESITDQERVVVTVKDPDSANYQPRALSEFDADPDRAV
jgi:hypothetical protein